MKMPSLSRIFLLVSLFSVCSFSEESVFISLTHDSKQPVCAGDGKNLYLCWIDNRDGSPAIYIRTSKDEGISWSGDQKLSRREKSQCFPPTIAAANGNIHVAWIDYGNSIDGELCYVNSADNGATWSEERILSGDTNSARFPIIIKDSGRLYLVWQDVQNRIFFKTSADNGKTWENDVFLSRLQVHSCFCYPPALGMAKGVIAVIYADLMGNKDKAAINYRLSADYGKTWQEAKNITKFSVDSEIAGEISNPVVSYNGISDFHLFWIDKRNFRLGEIYYSRSVDSGKTWTKETKLFKEKKSPKRQTTLVGRNGIIHLAWASFLGGKSVINYARSIDNGKTWNRMEELSGFNMRYHDPAIAETESGALHIFWFIESDEGEWSKICYKRSIDSGKTWHNWDYFHTPKK